MKNPTTLGAITPGEAKLFSDRAFTEVTSSTSKCPLIHWSGFDDSDRSLEEHRANAALYADAHNTANATGKLPSQLLAERDELASMLQEWVDQQDGIRSTVPLTRTRELLSKYPKP